MRKSSHAPQPRGSPDLTTANLAAAGPETRKTPHDPYCGACRIQCGAPLIRRSPGTSYRLKTHLFQYEPTHAS